MVYTLITFLLGLCEATGEVPIKVTLAYEVDCPDCQRYFRDQLSSDFTKEAMTSDSLTLELLPYGNAKSWDRCQHGFTECQRNMLDACLLHYTKSEEPYAVLTVVRCMEGEFQSHKYANNGEVLRKCLEKNALTVPTEKLFSQVYDSCYGTDGKATEGKELILEIAKKTDPKHTYVPWVSIQGVHSQAAEMNLRDAICTLYPHFVPCQRPNDAHVPSSVPPFFPSSFLYGLKKCWNNYFPTPEEESEEKSDEMMI